jgi:hypothetical protein
MLQQPQRQQVYVEVDWNLERWRQHASKNVNETMRNANETG